MRRGHGGKLEMPPDLLQGRGIALLIDIRLDEVEDFFWSFCEHRLDSGYMRSILEQK